LYKLSNLKCFACGSENIEDDLAICSQQQLFFSLDDRELISVSLCKDCGTVRHYVKNPERKYYNQTEKDSATKIYYSNIEAKAATQKKKKRCKADLIYMAAILILLASVFCTNDRSFQIDLVLLGGGVMIAACIYE